MTSDVMTEELRLRARASRPSEHLGAMEPRGAWLGMASAGWQVDLRLAADANTFTSHNTRR